MTFLGYNFLKYSKILKTIESFTIEDPLSRGCFIASLSGERFSLFRPSQAED